MYNSLGLVSKLSHIKWNFTYYMGQNDFFVVIHEGIAHAITFLAGNLPF
jgi:hypothetical protein